MRWPSKRRFELLVLAFGLLGVTLGACASKGSSNADARLCTPGAYVFCRCADLTAGTKLCSNDGQSFATCSPCDAHGGEAPGDDDSNNPIGPNGPTDPNAGDDQSDAGPIVPPDAGGFTPIMPTMTDDAGTVTPVDDSGPTPPPGPTIDARCAGKLGVFAGSADTSNEFVYAGLFDGTSFKVWSSSGVPLRSAVQSANLNGELVAVYRSRNNWLVSVTYKVGDTAPQTMQVGSAQTDQAPTIAPWGTTLKAVYHGTDGKYYAGNFDPANGGWDSATEAVGTSGAGTSAPGSASAGTPGFPGSSLVVGFADDQGAIYREEWLGDTWLSSPIKAQASAANAGPALIAMTGGAFDLVSTFIGSDGVLRYATRTTQDTGNMWSAVSALDPGATPLETPSAAPIAGGGAIVTWRDATSKKPLFSIFDPSVPKWSAPADLVPGGANPVVASAPMAIRGTCGEDASVVYAEDGGKVAIMRLSGTTWTGPFVVPGISNVTFAGIGELP